MTRITITLTLSCPLADAVAGLRSVDDDGDELLRRLEDATAVTVEPYEPAAPAVPVGVAEAAALYATTRSVAAVARALGCARSTVRARLRRAGVAPANDDGEERDAG